MKRLLRTLIAPLYAAAVLAFAVLPAVEAAQITVVPQTQVPIGATFLTQTADPVLTGEQAMGALATGLVKNTTSTGVQSIVVPATGIEAWLATPNAANFAAAQTGETGTGAPVLGTGPAISAPVITGAATIAQMQVNGGAVITALTTGTYTPTATIVTNTDGVTAAVLKYMQVGDTVTVWGGLQADASAGGFAAVRLTVPIASTFTAVGDAVGSNFLQSNGTETGGVVADTATGKVDLRWTAVSTANVNRLVTFSYTIK